MSIYEIKERTKKTAPYFFNRATMKFFSQTLKDFSVKKQIDGRFKITAPIRSKWDKKRAVSNTIRYFNPMNNELEYK